METTETKVFKISGDIVASQVKDLVAQSKSYLEDTGSAVVMLDISAVEYIDSTGISFLIGLYKTAAARNREMQIRGVKPEIQKLFKLMKLDELFRIENA